MITGLTKQYSALKNDFFIRNSFTDKTLLLMVQNPYLTIVTRTLDNILNF